MTAEAKGTGAVKGKATDGRMSGTLKSKGDGKVAIEFTGKLGTTEIPKTVVVSDGKQVRCASGAESRARAHTEPVGKLAREGFVRAGLFGVAGSFVLWAYVPDTFPLDKIFQVSNAADGGTEKVGDRACRIVKYTLTVSDVKVRNAECRVWIDAEKLVILKREITKESEVIVETYADPVFDAEIADDAFALPK